MLRLKPSEVTLTPDDVDETLRRMARRQQSRASAAQGQQRTRPTYGKPPPPRLMPGPQRSVRDTVTHLGHIPALQPQQTIVAHVDDEPDESGMILADPAQRAKSSPDPLGLRTHPLHLVPASLSAAAPSARHSARLPFRLGRSRRRQDHDQEPASSLKEQTQDSEGILVEPLTLPVETIDVAGPATPSRRTQQRDSSADSSLTRQRSLSPSSVSLRGGASRSTRSRVLSVGQEAFHAPSPLCQAHVVSSPYSPEGSNSDDGRPLMSIEGHFVDRQDPAPRRIHSGISTDAGKFTSATTYTLKETVRPAPHTEPFRRTSQPRFHSRSQSSNDAAPSRLFMPTSTSPYISGDDVFWTATDSAPEHFAVDKSVGRARQHSSEMSNTTLAYSYYELPDSRQSSGEQSAQFLLPQSQCDGVTASRQPSCGTYRSVRLTDAQPLYPVDDPADFSTMVCRTPDQQGASTLPAGPYGHPSAGHLGTRFQQAIHRYVSSGSSRRHVPNNAVAAAIEERASPLDILEAQIERASHHLGEQHGRQYRRSHPESVHSAYRNTGARRGSHDQHRYGYGASSATFEQPTSRLGLPLTAMADDPYTRGVSAHVGLSRGSPVLLPSAQPVSAASYDPPYARSTHVGRVGQRSSENAIFGPSDQERRAVRTSQVQDHVYAFEQMQNAAQPRWVSNSCNEPRSAGGLTDRHRYIRHRTEAFQAAPAQHQQEQLSSPIFGPPVWDVPPRHSSHHHAVLSPAQGNAGRRPPRMDTRRQNQENSGEAEVEMMRQELESVRMRFDEGQYGDVMDETPPRIGRVERHM